MKTKIKKWKAYLFSLSDRLKDYWALILRTSMKGENIGRLVTVDWCKEMLTRYRKGDKVNQTRPYILWEVVKTVRENRHRCTQVEFERAMEIKERIKHLHLEDLKMETKQIKAFCKEVGINYSKVKEMDEDDIILKIVEAVDNTVDYSDEFIAWYNDLPEDMFDEEDEEEAEEKPKKKKKSKEKEVEVEEETDVPDLEELQDSIDSADDVDELKEIIKDNDSLFSAKLLKVKDFEELQEKMILVIEELQEEKEKEKVEKKVEKKPEKVVKKKKVEEVEEDEEDEGDDEEEENESELISKWKKMNPMQLKKVAKEFNLVTKKTDTKEQLLKRIITAYEAKQEGVEESEEEVEVEVDQSLVKKLIKTKDIDKLIEIAEELEIKVSALDKRSPQRLGGKIIDFLTEQEEEKEIKKKKSEKKVEKKVEKKAKKRSVEDEVEEEDDEDEEEKPKRGRGRPPKKKVEEEVEEEDDDEEEAEKPKKRGRGRPPGSKNKKELKSKKKEEESESKGPSKKSIYRKIERLMEKGKSEKEIIKLLTPDFIESGKDADYAKRQIKRLIAMVDED